MSHAKELVRLYSQFYRANRPFQASSYTLLRPLDIVADTLLNADKRLFSDADALIEVARGQLHDRLDSSEANAYIVKGASADAYQREFCAYFVNEIFIHTFNQDEAALRGKQLNLLRSACEVLYLDVLRQAYADRTPSTASDQTQA
jgi:CRISPR-associated protein Csc3